jgi:CheY-like chemotaxis protein
MILIVDNEVGIRSLLLEVLLPVGAPLVTAADGTTALSHLQAGGVELLICDLMMPGILGLELLDRITELPRPPRVLVVSGCIDTDTERRLGAHRLVRHVFRKPFDLDALVRAVRAELGQVPAPAAE